MQPFNEVPPGDYPDLQAAKPYPAFGQLNVLENLATSSYNGLQVKWERRFAQGLSFMASYAFSKNLSDNMPQYETDLLTPFAPNGYNRGRSSWDRTHILTVNAVYELPFGRGRAHMANVNRAVDLALGGWQLSGIYSFTSGAPLSISVPGATLGNGWNTRANLTGDPQVSDPNASMWFNTGAFAAPPEHQWGNSGIGILDGPANQTMNLGLMKNFFFTESKYLQLRFEAYNAFNHVNLDTPGTNLGTGDFGLITSAGSARTVQVGLKFLF